MVLSVKAYSILPYQHVFVKKKWSRFLYVFLNSGGLLCFVILGVFLGLGLSGIVPTLHFTIAEGFVKATTVGQMGWFFLMAVMYITGAGLYAARIPERFFPGKFDIWVSVVCCSEYGSLLLCYEK